MTETARRVTSPIKAYIEALRPKTLTASLVPVIVGTMIAPHILTTINYFLFASVLFTALFIQIGTNLVNDALDFIKGADTEKRLGPKRLIQQGLMGSKGVLYLGAISFLLALITAIPVFSLGGLPLIGIVVLSILCGYLYTGGPYPLAYRGLGELFVLIFFGPVLTGSAYYVQTAHLSFDVIVAGIEIGLLATVLIAINNLRDIEEDQKANKRTLAVKLGIPLSKGLIALFLFTPYVLNFYWIKGNLLLTLFPMFTLPMAFNLMRGILKTRPSQAYNRFLQDAALLHLCFGLLFAMGANLIMDNMT